MTLLRRLLRLAGAPYRAFARAVDRDTEWRLKVIEETGEDPTIW